jgi:pterin-4a-carbinolamine dehydratase
MGELPRHKLSDAELQEALKSLPGWKAEKDKLHREYNFDDFVET